MKIYFCKQKQGVYDANPFLLVLWDYRVEIVQQKCFPGLLCGFRDIVELESFLKLATNDINSSLCASQTGDCFKGDQRFV